MSSDHSSASPSVSNNSEYNEEIPKNDSDAFIEPISNVPLVEDPETSCEVFDDEPKSIILSLLKQLKLNSDLHRVTLPTFILEPRSLLERITDFMSFPEFIIHAPLYEDPIDRFKAVLKYYLSAWHIRPKGVKKPYNPILGEFFRCQWEYPRAPSSFEDTFGRLHVHSDSEILSQSYKPLHSLQATDEAMRHSMRLDPSEYREPFFKCPHCETCPSSTSYFLAEQVSHHPPVSAFFYSNPSHHLAIQGNFRPGSKFLGNSAVSYMRGATHIHFLNRAREVYTLTNPNYYIRGLFLGTMLMELGDPVKIECEATGLTAEIDFKTKGFFTGTYNALSGKIKMRDKKTGKDKLLFTLSGKWTDVITLTDAATGLKEEFLNIGKLHLKCHKRVPPTDAQSFYESRQLWLDVTESLERRDYDAATNYKTLIEDDQRMRKVAAPLLLPQHEANQLVSWDGLDPTPLYSLPPSSPNFSSSSISNRSSNTSLTSATPLDFPVYKVLVDSNSNVPLITRYFQSKDGINWSFKFFHPNNTSSQGVDAKPVSSENVIESKDGNLSVAPHASYSQRDLSKLLQSLFVREFLDDYMDKTFYISLNP